MKFSAKLLTATPISVALFAIRNCYDSFDSSPTLKDGFVLTNDISEKDKDLITKKIMTSGHYSTLEHINFTFDVVMDRAILQEWSRHRIHSQSTKSTRYTLNKLKNKFKKNDPDLKEFIQDNLSPNLDADMLEDVTEYIMTRMSKYAHLPNDKLKLMLPESWMTRSVDTFNVRSLRNLFAIRSAPSAHFGFVELANLMYTELPEEYKFLFSDIFNKETK